MRSNPSLTQAEVDSITARSRAAVTEAEALRTSLDSLYTEANGVLGEGCGGLWAPAPF